jgi:hypothetical protein
MSSPLASLRTYRSAIALFLFVTYLPACTSWHVGTPTPAEFVRREQPNRVRLTRVDGSQLMLVSPSVQGDSLSGKRETLTRGSEPTTEPFTVPLADVQTVAVRKYSAGRTLLLLSGIVGVLLVAWLVDCSGRSGWEAIGCP